ncbi:MAG TPA: LysM peptidoglycan-binding domain-containing M23 family metallopeptidase [Deltaproteobacteria bacterium]|nr:LysM peptidoglycan-binding domain-containing M23 family metallopeptidase [Deltaproteobacteria bacterium]
MRFLIQFSTAVLLAFLILPSSGMCSIGSSTHTAGPLLVKERISIPEEPEETSRPILRVHTVRPGDTLSGILEKSGISRKNALYIAKKADRVYRLSKIRPGGRLELYFTPDGRGLQEVDYKVNARTRKVLYNGRVVACAQVKAPSALTSRNVKTRAPAVIARSQKPAERSLRPKASIRRKPEGPPAPQEALTDRATSPASMDPSPMKLMASYAPGLPWDVAHTGLTPYDYLADGYLISPIDAPWDDTRITGNFPKPLKKKSISSAKKGSSRGKKRIAQGKSRKDNRYRPFLNAPLAYRYISSGYTSARIHPVTNIEQPHYGIDYAAPMGTPVRSVGPGTVVYVGWDGGFGKTIRIKHAGGITTHYGHLSLFARGVRPGKRVKQGEVIGRVGMSGLATGPHLDFRVTYRGGFVNPAKLSAYVRKNVAGAGPGG